MQREPKAQSDSSKDYVSASNTGPRSDHSNSRPEGKTSPCRRGRIPTRTSPAGESKECRSRLPVREGAPSQQHQAEDEEEKEESHLINLKR